MGLAVAGKGRELVVDLHDDRLRLFQHPAVDLGAPKGAAHPAVFIRRGAGDDRHPGIPGGHPVSGGAQVGGDELNIAVGHQLPLPGKKVGVVGYQVHILRRQQRRVQRSEERVQFNMAADGPQAPRQGAVHGVGPVGGGGHHNGILIPNQRRRVIGRHA